MKNIYKRLLAFVMMATMMLSSSIAVFATEPEEKVENPISVVGYQSEDTVDSMDYVDANTNYVSQTGKYLTSNDYYSTHFTMTRDQYLHIQFAIVGGAKIKVSIRNGLVTSTMLEETVTNNAIFKVSTKQLQEGCTVYVSLDFTQDTEDYALIIYGNDDPN